MRMYDGDVVFKYLSGEVVSELRSERWVSMTSEKKREQYVQRP